MQRQDVCVGETYRREEKKICVGEACSRDKSCAQAQSSSGDVRVLCKHSPVAEILELCASTVL